VRELHCARFRGIEYGQRHVLWCRTFDQALGLVLQVIIGAIIGLTIICLIEDYLAICYRVLDVKLGERPAGQFCYGEP
jgi:hypothetical protein